MFLFCRFDYSGKSKIEYSGHSKVVEEAQASGTCDAVFMWWDLEMDTKGKILLSCAPRWAHPTPDNMAVSFIYFNLHCQLQWNVSRERVME